MVTRPGDRRRRNIRARAKYKVTGIPQLSNGCNTTSISIAAPNYYAKRSTPITNRVHVQTSSVKILTMPWVVPDLKRNSGYTCTLHIQLHHNSHLGDGDHTAADVCTRATIPYRYVEFIWVIQLLWHMCRPQQCIVFFVFFFLSRVIVIKCQPRIK